MYTFPRFSACCLALSLLLLLPVSLGHAAESKAPEAIATPQVITPEQFLATMLGNAEQGDARAMLVVAGIYQQGLGVPPNYSKVLEWSEKAAFAGEAEGYLRLGQCYETGMGTPVNMEKAVKAYEQAISMNHPVAQHKLATLLLAGRGLPKNIEMGLALLQKSADNGFSIAANELGFIHYQGLFGQKADLAKAKSLFLKGAEAGNLEAIKNYAVMLKDGLGQKADPQGALRWFLIGHKGGLDGGDLQAIVDGLKKQLKPAEIEQAEKDAEAFVTAFAEKQGQVAPPQTGQTGRAGQNVIRQKVNK